MPDLLFNQFIAKDLYYVLISVIIILWLYGYFNAVLICWLNPDIIPICES